MNPTELVRLAKTAMQHAYVPYSGYKVGAALLTKGGKVYLGCNIENAAFGPSNCAERTAFFTAIAAGETEFESIAVVGGKNGVVTDIFPPCGPDFMIYMGRGDDSYEAVPLEQLLPYGFNAAKYMSAK